MYSRKDNEKVSVSGSGKIIRMIKERTRHVSFYLFLILSLILITSLVRNVSRILSAGERIETTRSQIEALKKENAQLKSKINNAKSDFYIEKSIRDKLGLSKPGETVVVLPEIDLSNLDDEENNQKAVKIEKNWQKWLKIFRHGV